MYRNTIKATNIEEENKTKKTKPKAIKPANNTTADKRETTKKPKDMGSPLLENLDEDEM